MFETHEVILDCQTCVATNTTACSECVVSHLLANDAGPIELRVTPAAEVLDHAERAVGLFVKAGLLDDEPEFVAYADFEAGRVPDMSR